MGLGSVAYEKLLDLGVDEGWSIEKLVAEITDNRVLVDFTKKLVNANAARIDEVRRLLVYSMRFDLICTVVMFLNPLNMC